MGVADGTWMPSLRVEQAVTLSLDEVPETIECRVVEVQGSITRLAYRDQLPPDAVGRLVQGSTGYLVFDEAGNTVGLRVIVRASPPYLDVAAMDGLAMAERRAWHRVKLVTRVRIISPDDGDGDREWTHTIDLSEGGALLRAHAAFTDHQQVALELTFGENLRPITTQAKIVRRAQDAIGVAFEAIDPDDATRLGDYLASVEHHRGLAIQH